MKGGGKVVNAWVHTLTVYEEVAYNAYSEEEKTARGKGKTPDALMFRRNRKWQARRLQKKGQDRLFFGRKHWFKREGAEGILRQST